MKIEMLLYPLQGRMLGWLLLMSAAALLFQGVTDFSATLALLLGGLWWLMAFKLASDALADAARGNGARADGGGHAIEGLALRQVLLGAGLIGFAWLVEFLAGGSAALAACVGLALLLPAMVMVLVTRRSLLHAIDPGQWLQLLRQVGSDYLVLALKLTALGAAVALAFVFVFAPLPAWLATTVMHFIALYALLAGYHAMGALLRRHHATLGMPAADSGDDAPPRLEPEEAAMSECEQLVANGRADEGAAALERFIAAGGASAALHSRYRELLTGLGDNQGLLRHAHGYVAVLLRQGKEREAMALYLASRAMYGDFEVQDAGLLGELVAVARRSGQDKLARALAEEYARRFPGGRDLVLDG